MTKRGKFLKAEWRIASDGLWENPKADPNCKTCRGRGILDDGYLVPKFINCTECWRTNNMAAFEHIKKPRGRVPAHIAAFLEVNSEVPWQMCVCECGRWFSRIDRLATYHWELCKCDTCGTPKLESYK